jgi:hypothetical protein
MLRQTEPRLRLVPTPPSGSADPAQEELHLVELPEREALSVVNGPLLASLGAATSAGLLGG